MSGLKNLRAWSFGNNYNGRLGLGHRGGNIHAPKQIKTVENVRAISAGSFHSLLLDHDGQVWTFGDSGKINVIQPTLIPNLKNIQEISAGGFHDLFLDDEGKVWVWGSNGFGQLGIGRSRSDEIIKTPIQLDLPFKVKSISAGENHSLILDQEGQVYSFGNNTLGGLGLGDERERNIPTMIELPFKVKAISAGDGFSLILVGKGEEDGQVWSFGDNYEGQLGIGNSDSRTFRNIPTLIENIPKIKEISAGEAHSLILDEEGRVWSFGQNEFGQLGLGHKLDQDTPNPILSLPPIQSISAGEDHSLVLDKNGNFWGFGLNENGQLGMRDEMVVLNPILNSKLNQVQSISTGYSYSLVLAPTISKGEKDVIGELTKSLSEPSSFNIDEGALLSQLRETIMDIQSERRSIPTITPSEAGFITPSFSSGLMGGYHNLFATPSIPKEDTEENENSVLYQLD